MDIMIISYDEGSKKQHLALMLGSLIFGSSNDPLRLLF